MIAIRRPGRRAWRWLAAGAALFLVLWGLLLAAGFTTADESWLLRVVDRVAAGDQLYTDVFYGVPPLHVWIPLPFIAAIGTELAIMKASSAAVAATGALLAVWIAGRLGFGWVGCLLIGIAALAFHQAGSAYTGLAYMLLLACLAAVLAWRERVVEHGGDSSAARTALVLAGLAAGLAAASKQSVGVTATLALVAVVVLASPRASPTARARARDAGVAGAAVSIGFLVPMLPVLLSGALPDFVTYVVNKGAYVEEGSISYLENFRTIREILTEPAVPDQQLLDYYSALFPPLALLALLAAARSDRSTAAVLGAFTVAAIVPIFPRADIPHVWPAATICVISLAWSARALSRRASPSLAPLGVAAVAGVALCLVATIEYNLVSGPVHNARGDYRLADLPHFWGTLSDPTEDQAHSEVAAALRRIDDGTGTTLLLTPTAGFLYLISGLESPTRHDYPVGSTFRGDDERELMRMIASREIRHVCIGAQRVDWVAQLAPDDLHAYVRSRMERVGRLGPPPSEYEIDGCTLFR